MTPLSLDLVREIVTDHNMPLDAERLKDAGQSNSGMAFGLNIDDVGSHHEERYGEIRHPSHGFSIQHWPNRVEVRLDYRGNRVWDGQYFYVGPSLSMTWRFTHRQWIAAMAQESLFDV